MDCRNIILHSGDDQETASKGGKNKSSSAHNWTARSADVRSLHTGKSAFSECKLCLETVEIKSDLQFSRVLFT